MHEVIAVVLAAALTGLGFLVRRWLGRESVDEIIARRLKLVALCQRMRSAKLDVESLERLEQELGDK